MGGSTAAQQTYRAGEVAKELWQRIGRGALVVEPTRPLWWHPADEEAEPDISAAIDGCDFWREFVLITTSGPAVYARTIEYGSAEDIEVTIAGGHSLPQLAVRIAFYSDPMRQAALKRWNSGNAPVLWNEDEDEDKKGEEW